MFYRERGRKKKSSGLIAEDTRLNVSTDLRSALRPVSLLEGYSFTSIKKTAETRSFLCSLQSEHVIYKLGRK